MKISKHSVYAFNILIHEHINNWKCLPDYLRTVIDNKICEINITHGHPGSIITNSNKSVTHNYDLIITNQDDVDIIDKRKIVLPRWRKSHQAKIVEDARAAAHAKYPNLISIKTRDIGNINNTGYKDMPLLEDGSYVLKPNYGARGMAMLFFDVVNKEKKTLTSALKKLNEAITEAEKTSPRGIPELSNDDCNFIVGDYNTPDEVVSTWCSMRGWCLQKVVKNVVAEYRVIKGVGQIDFVLKRPTHIVAGQSVVSSDADELIYSKYNSAEFSYDLKDVIPEEAKHFIEYVLPNCSSSDLFVCDDGTWGIFEFSNQFYLEDIPQNEIVKAHILWLEEMLLEKYKLEA